MKATTPKRQRCAIYTRKSTEHNLDLAFNSLDAQREASEAYIKSQAHEGWSLVPTAYDDGGLSGASLDRPALQQLLEAVRARKIDIIVVYKVDRLTRSLADFAKLVELFDEYDVSFVSVTQSFNTTTSMGRLTLNVLLSFAQFEREVIGERVRDKIAASKRKGIWVGGPVPLGYRSVDKKLEVVPEEAALVRRIFADYLRLGSIAALAGSLNTEGLKPKPRKLANGRSVQAAAFTVGPLAHLLKNRFYIGEVAYKGEIHPGWQEPIVSRELFDAVQARIADGKIARQTLRSASPAILSGKLFDDRGQAMSPTHANKAGVRYRYYTSQALLQGRKADAGSIARVSAPEIEQLVLTSIGSGGLAADDPAVAREHIEARVLRIVVVGQHLTLALRGEDGDAGEIISVPFAPTTVLRKGVAHAPTDGSMMNDKTRSTMLRVIARSKRWVDELLSGNASGFHELAIRDQLAEPYVRFLAPLAFLSPRIIEAIVEGRATADLDVTRLARTLPMQWNAQEARL